MQTLSAFRKGVEWAREGQFTQQDLDEAKLSVFSAVDSPVAPSDKGETSTVSTTPAAVETIRPHFLRLSSHPKCQ